jgi:hypothetical protein
VYCNRETCARDSCRLPVELGSEALDADGFKTRPLVALSGGVGRVGVGLNDMFSVGGPGRRPRGPRHTCTAGLAVEASVRSTSFLRSAIPPQAPRDRRASRTDCREARRGRGVTNSEQGPLVPGAKREDWPLQDLKELAIERVREIRDEIKRRVAALVVGRGGRCRHRDSLHGESA